MSYYRVCVLYIVVIKWQYNFTIFCPRFWFFPTSRLLLPLYSVGLAIRFLDFHTFFIRLASTCGAFRKVFIKIFNCASFFGAIFIYRAEGRSLWRTLENWSRGLCVPGRHSTYTILWWIVICCYLKYLVSFSPAKTQWRLLFILTRQI